MSVSVRRVVCRVFLTAVAALLPAAAHAADYTDLWWTPSEPGWGVNVVQSDTFMFLTFFIYGADNKPTWYTAQLTQDSSGNFNGGLYATAGTYYARPWSTADSTPPQQVGSVQFRPSTTNAYQATLAYAVDGVGSVLKSVERQMLTPIRLGGTYTGGLAGVQSGCSPSGSYKIAYDLQVTQSSSSQATLAFTFPTYACTLSGALVQHGTQYSIDNASYACSGATSFSTSAAISQLKATAQGIEGQWVAPINGCTETAYFSAVLL